MKRFCVAAAALALAMTASAADNGGEWVKISEVLPGEEYRDYQAASGQSYEYRVRGVAP